MESFPEFIKKLFNQLNSYILVNIYQYLGGQGMPLSFSSVSRVSDACRNSSPSLRVSKPILLQTFSYLDTCSLLCAGCVCKRFYRVSNDNLIWYGLYSNCFKFKGKLWKPKAVESVTESFSTISIQDKPAGHWKRAFIQKCIGVGRRGVEQLLKPINHFTGLPSKLKEAVRALEVTWKIVLQDRTGREHSLEQSKVFLSDTSATLYWYSALWPPLDSLKTLCLYGVTPLHLPNITSAMNRPSKLSLLFEYELTHLENSSTYMRCDKLVRLQCLHPSILLGLWQYSPPSHEPVLDDIDPEYGLHGYYLHITLHSGQSCYMSGSFRSLFCKKGKNNYLFQRIPSKKESQHSTISGKLCLPWNTEFLSGKHCCFMDVTVLDEAEKPFWCVSSPVAVYESSTSATRYDYLGKSQTIDYSDSEGRVHMNLMWLEEERQYYLVNLVLYLSTEKVNSWFATKY
uniref:F-box protein 15 n=1 Tax=Callorhinchus milii TaxID=7868 RepID=A0A4W3HVI5_CALMI